MLRDTIMTKDVFVIPAHPWPFQNIVADRTMKIFVDMALKPVIIVAIFLFCRARSHSLQLAKYCSHLSIIVLDTNDLSL
jgi:hypothetical protein